MALTIDKIFDRNQVLNIITKIEFKRQEVGGTYEADWHSIQELFGYPVVTTDVISTMSTQLPNQSYRFGIVQVPDCKLKLLSNIGEFADETNSNSIFFGYIRHRTQVKISQGYRDSKTGEKIYQEVYRGFINDQSTGTKVDKDNMFQFLQIEDMLNFLLKEFTYSQFTLTSLTLNDFIYEIMNDVKFTEFLTVDSGNINAGYDIQHIYQSYIEGSETKYAWEGQTQILTILEELSTGHSIFYQRAGVFYYKSITPSGSVVRNFGKDKIISFQNYARGISQVYERLYWKDGTAEYLAPTNKYNRTKTFDIPAVRDFTDKSSMLATIGSRTAIAKRSYKLKIPIYPGLFILDITQVEAGAYIPEDAFVLGKSKLGVDYLRNPRGASNVDSSSFWSIYNVKHDFNGCTTTLVMEETFNI